MKRIATLFVSLALLVPVGALALPGAALANSTCQSYSSQTCQVASTTESRTTGTSPSTTTNASTLPFTGLDVVLLAAGGGGLLGAGLVMRRLARGTE
jgi:hypothetical protein